MYLPELYEGNVETVQTTTFLGYNHNPVIQDGEMYDMKNLTGDGFPLLSQRKQRYTQSLGDDAITGIHGRDQLVFTRGRHVYYAFREVPGVEVSDNPEMCPKKIVSMGAYVCIWPDKVYFNTVDPNDCGSMERLWGANGTRVDLIMCRGDGKDYDMTQIEIGTEAPANPRNGQLWMDISGEKNILRQYSESTGDWSLVESTYIKISATGIGANLREYDVVNISGLEANTSRAMTRLQEEINTLNTSNIIYFRSDDFIIVAGFLSQPVSIEESNMRADLRVPDLDYIVESNNRLWGCIYGQVDGVVYNEIKACKLGDFRNWNCYMGLSSDSYTASVGTDGVWTGAVTQQNYPVFFKENCIHRVSGSAPSNFGITTTVCRGVQKGSWRSAVVVNEYIYYKSRKDVMMYDGSMPVSVSTAFGEKLYSDARAGTIGGKYYISMLGDDGEWVQMVYDINKQLWHKEDAFHSFGYATEQDTLYAVNEDTGDLTQIIGTGGEGWTEEAPVEWDAVFGLFGTDYVNQKYLSRFNIRLQMAKGASAKLWIQYDSSGKWVYDGEIKAPELRTVMIPVIPKRCDHLQVKLTGVGKVKIYSLARLLEVGGDGGAF